MLFSAINRSLGAALTCVAAIAMCTSCSDNKPAPAVAAPTTVIEGSFDGGRFGSVRTYRPSSPITHAALFFSGDGGWTPEAEEMARKLALEGFVVAGVDTTLYMEAIQPKSSKAPCTYIAGDMEALSQHLQWKMQMPEYLPPVLFGYSSGSSIVYGTLAESVRGTFAGGVGLSFCSEMDTNAAQLCPGKGLTYTHAASGKSINLSPDAKMIFPLTVVQGRNDDVCPIEQARKFVAGIPTAQFIELPDSDHDLMPTEKWWPQLRKNYRAMVVNDRTRAKPASVKAAVTAALSLDVSDLPLEEVPATATQSDVFTVLISGDGGWAGLDQGISAALARHGIPVVGMSSLKYFWHARTPDGTAADVTRVIESYAARWRKKRVLLVGYSFGADVMPFVFNRLPEGTRAKVASVSFLGLGPAVSYEVTVGEWLPGHNAKGDPTVPEIARMRAVPRLCVEGKGENDSECPDLKKLGVTVRVIGDGHHFSGLEDDIAQAILDVAGVTTAKAP